MFYSLLETRHLRLSVHYVLPKSKLIYPAKIELKIKASALLMKENKEEQRSLRGEKN